MIPSFILTVLLALPAPAVPQTTQQTTPPAQSQDERMPDEKPKPRERNKSLAPEKICVGGLCKERKRTGPSSSREQTAATAPASDTAEQPAQNSAQEGNSSSRDTKVPLDPKERQKQRGSAEIEPAEGVTEMHTYDPHLADKSLEVGEYYFKRKNYRAALSRYLEALEYKPDDARALFRLGQVYEKLNDREKARDYYGDYLKILPEGRFSKEAKEGLARLK